ncbi:MAG TPA: glutathione peroxidase [Armatimonadota bacterium]|jgi:glutathione peroxidase
MKIQPAVRRASALLIATALAGAAFAGPRKETRVVTPLLNRTMKSLDGKPVNLADYRGKVLMIVNTASKCGNTPQYAGLEEVYNKYKDRGFVILGFPANNFLSQEPGNDAQIREFCTKNYGVTFPMFSKISVKGKDQDPLYKFLTDKTTDPQFGGDIDWNFAKFLVNRQGQVVARFKAGHKPTEPDVIAAIEHEL